MNKTGNVLITFFTLLLFSAHVSAQHVGSPIGFATVAGYGVSGVTGGKGGEVVLISGSGDAKKLQDALDDDDAPRIIYISGTVQLPEYPKGTLEPVSDVTMRMTAVRSNKSIIGLGNNAKIVKSGLSIYSGNGEGNPQEKAVNNIIIQNISFEGAPDDAINIQGGSHHIWIDHCSFTDGSGPSKDADGQIDIKRGSDFVTVSYCYFTNHYKMCLVGHSNKAKEIDTGHLRVTFDHCYWKDGNGSSTSSRHPRVRFGSVHVLNCLIEGRSDKNCEGVVSQCDAKVWIEGTHFKYCKSGGSTSEHSEGDGYVKSTNNSDEGCGPKFGYGRTFSSTAVFNYNYIAESSKSVAGSLPGKAGAGKINPQKVAIATRTHALRQTPSISIDAKSTTLVVSGQDIGLSPVAILDLSGRTILNNITPTAHTRGYSISIKELPSGTYLLATSGRSTLGSFHRY